jgi:hypothetical protein
VPGRVLFLRGRRLRPGRYVLVVDGARIRVRLT